MNTSPWWSESAPALLRQLGSSATGLSAELAARRLAENGPNTLAAPGVGRSDGLLLLLRQFLSPIVLILLGAALLSFALDSPTDGAIILLIVLASGLLGFWQEFTASRAVSELLAVVELRTTVLRDGTPASIPMVEVVVGDVVLLAAGDGVPADCRVLEERDLSVDEATLTGESVPVAKGVEPSPADTPLTRRANALHLGTHVVSGTARAVVVATGHATSYGAIANSLRLRSGETEFERGIRRFGNLLLEVTLLLIVAIFAFNVYLKRPVIDSFLFALALGVGLTPQLLPAIISVNLARGARAMARCRVIVKRLASIENFGSMDVLCTDKTGTLTEGSARLQAALSADGRESPRVQTYACLNAAFESGFPNPIDEALRGLEIPAPGWCKLDEKPFDFHRKRQSLLLQPPPDIGTTAELISKGALPQILAVCTLAEAGDGSVHPLADLEEAIGAQARSLSADGYRLLGVARRTHPPDQIGAQSEQAMTFLGLIALADPLKPGIAATLAELGQLGVRLKIITGDNALVAARLGQQAGLDASAVITGGELLALSDEALPLRAQACDIFAEVEPNQKQRLILALRRAGHVVGYMGDGINDAPALHSADVGLSVQGAVDVAKEAADIVLLEHDLNVLTAGIREGRRTFANTLKYVFMATSANFGNMFSMAGASLLLPFLPLLPKQILLTNLLTDLPEMTIATDRVDADWIERPRRWDIAFIRRFMLSFGLVSSVFDYLTFAILLLMLHSDEALFRTGWFVESVVSAASIVLVVRTRGPLLASRPSRSLMVSTLLVVIATLLLPASPLGSVFGFVPLPPLYLLLLSLILLGYVLAAELVKRRFYGSQPRRPC